MGIHLAVLSCVIFLGIFLLNKNNIDDVKRKKQFIILCWIVIFFVIAFRATSVGLDTRIYNVFFKRLAANPDFNERMGWEPLFVLFVKLGIFFDSFQVVCVLCAAVTCIGFGVFTYYNTDNKAAAFWYIYFYITLNLYFNSMHLMRQICAMAIAINIYTLLRKEKGIKRISISIGLIVIASLFHITAAIFTIPIFVTLLIGKITRRMLIMTVLLSFAGGFFLTVGQGFLLSNIDRFSRYAEDDRLYSGNFGVYAFAIIIIKVVITLWILRLDYNDESNQELYRLGLINVISTAFFILQTRTQFALRIGYWYEMFFPLLIPMYIEKHRIVSNRKLLFAMFFAFGLVYFIYMMEFGGVKSNRGTVPYLFFWQLLQ